MNHSITDVAGIEVGHAHDLESLTGCTVVLCKGGAVLGVDVRGAAPGTRETDLCRPGTLVREGHAILLTGGSAFGLDAASGVMRFLREENAGFDTGIIRVPIVPAAVIFDLGVGGVAWPDGEMAYEACCRASDGPVEQGGVGAGCGASVGKMLGPSWATKSGIGTASVVVGHYTVGAIVAVNAFGDVVKPGTDTVIAGARNPTDDGFAGTMRLAMEAAAADIRPLGNTTIGVVATDATLAPEAANHLASIAHDALARVIRPVHTMWDGDTIFALATGKVGLDDDGALLSLDVAVVAVTQQAIVNAVQEARPAGGLPSASDVRRSAAG